jgi:hypothetical protein
MARVVAQRDPGVTMPQSQARLLPPREALAITSPL